MAKMLCSGASGASSSGSDRCRYDVFLSFRGGDTRRGFTDHLYTELVRAGFHTFRDDDEIERGETIQTEIRNAIQESKLSLVVFSRDYASSRWCLDELVQIMDLKRSGQQHVIPVFYDVDPSEVRKQSGDYGEAFVRHEIRFKDEFDKVVRCRKALKDVADLGGMVLGNRSESLFIQDIVKEIRKKLDKPLLHVTPYLVGRRDLINDIDLWLQSWINDVGIAVIYGIGGVGKTTVANIIYNSSYARFDGSSFLANVREASMEFKGLIQLQEQLVSDLLKQKDIKIRNIDEGVMMIKQAICHKRVLLVLDDVDNLDQLNAIIGLRQWFSPGSRIIITTRCEHLLRTHDNCQYFKVSGLPFDEAVKLLSWYAFGQDHPIEDYVEVSKSMVRHFDALPLALQVVGSSLRGASIKVWESALKKLEMIIEDDILKALRISYDSLNDDHNKELFKDIACFFVGKNKDYATTILEGCGYYSEIGISNLINRSLLYIDGRNCLGMHQLIRDMGRTIVCRESSEPGKRSRLWQDNEAFAVLRDNVGTETIIGLSLDLRKFKQVERREAIKNEEPPTQSCSVKSFGRSTSFSDGNFSKRRRLGLFAWRSNHDTSRIDEVLETSALRRMRRLNLLLLNCVEFIGDFGEFPKGLVWLSWNAFSMESLPSKLCLEKLVTLEMCHSKLKDNWKRGKVLENLKILDLSHCQGLVRPLDFTGLPSLERLLLKCCLNLEGIDETVACLQKLLELDLEGCINLQKLSKEISALKSLEKLVLSRCSKLKDLPYYELGKLQSLKFLYLDGISLCLSEPASRDMTQLGFPLPHSWNSIFQSWFSPTSSRLSILSMASLPSSLVELNLANCNLSDDVLATLFNNLTSLEMLNLENNPIHELPESIHSFSRLWRLILRGCTKLHTLRQLPKSLLQLVVDDCLSLETIQWSSISDPEILLFSEGCRKLSEVQGLMKLKELTSTDREIIRNIGLFNLESVRSTEIEMFSVFANEKRKVPLQVLHERGISSIFLQGASSPRWYTYRCSGSSVSFDMPSHTDRTIRGLNICFELQENPTQLEYKRFARFPVIEIRNNTRIEAWSYLPSFYCPPALGKDMLWLSHWRFENGLKAGDNFSVSFRFLDCKSLVKHTYVDLVYEAEDGKEPPPVQDTSPWFRTVAGFIPINYICEPLE